MNYDDFGARSDMKTLHRCGSSRSNESMNLGFTVHEIRTRILQERVIEKVSDTDRQRLEDDWWLIKFLHTFNYDVDITLAIILECLRWRISFQAEHVSLLAIKPLLEKQIMYIHGRDLTDRPILWVNLAEYHSSTSTSLFEQLFVFWIERHFMDTRGYPLTILVDMTKTKIKNMDLNIFKFMLKALKYYYPGTVEDFLIFDSPTNLNALWKVVQSWLDTGHPVVQHIDREIIHEFIDTDYLRPHMGGEDTFCFTMNEIARCLPLAPSNTNVQENGIDVSSEFADSKMNLDNYPMRRSVKFDEGEENAERTAPLVLTRRPSRGPSVNGRRNGLPPAIKNLADSRLQSSENEWLRNAFVSISPRDELVLRRVEGELDFIDVVAVKNHSHKSLMFKIKTTSPEKFRVRPSTGIIAPEATEIIRVYLQSEYRQSCAREKFLLMTVETTSTNAEQFSEEWKKAPSQSKVEHKVRCKVQDEGTERPERRSSLLCSQETVATLREEIRRINNTQQMLIVVIAVLFALQLVFVLYARSNYNNLQSSFEEQLKLVGERTIPSIPNENEEL